MIIVLIVLFLVLGGAISGYLQTVGYGVVSKNRELASAVSDGFNPTHVLAGSGFLSMALDEKVQLIRVTRNNITSMDEITLQFSDLQGAELVQVGVSATAKTTGTSFGGAFGASAGAISQASSRSNALHQWALVVRFSHSDFPSFTIDLGSRLAEGQEWVSRLKTIGSRCEPAQVTLISSELERITHLWEKGALSDQEFGDAKRRILGQ